MRKITKILGIVVIVFILTGAALAVLARVLITPERVKEMVVPLVENTLHRKIELEDVKISLFSGIFLKNLIIQEREGPEPFVTVDNFILKYRFWPLLTLQVVIDEIHLERPRVKAVRLADGKFNFSDLLKSTNTTPPDQKTEDQTNVPAPGRKMGPLNLLVAKVSITDGELLFQDYSLGKTGHPGYKLSDLEIRTRNISFDSAFPFKMKARLNDSLLSLEGSGNLRTLEGQGELVLSDLDITAFTPYIKDRLPGILSSSKLSIKAKIEGNPQQLSSQGNIALKQVELTLDALKDTPIQDANLLIDYRLSADLKASSIELDEIKAGLNGLTVNFSGRVDDFTREPVVDITLNLPDQDISTALPAMSESLAKRFEDFKPEGSISARLHFLGPVARPNLLLESGEVHFMKVQAGKGADRPILNGSLRLRGGEVTSEKLKLTLGKEEADLDLKVKNLLGKPVGVTSRITSNRFSLDPLINITAVPAVAVQEKKAEEPSQKPSPTEKEPGPLDLPMKLTGEVQVKQLLYKDLTVDNFGINYHLDKNILTVDRMTGSMLEGSFIEVATIDLGIKGFSYTDQLTLTGISLEKFISAFSPKASNTIFGTLNLKADLKGRGTTSGAIQKNLAGQGDFLLKDVKLTGEGMAKSLADYLNLEELRIMRFSEGSGRFTIANGRVNLDSQFSGSDVRLKPVGYIGLDDSLDLSLNTVLSPQLTRKLAGQGRFTRFFTDEQGWGRVPLKVTGTVKAPGISLDTAAAQKMTQEKIVDKLQQKLRERIIDKNAPQEKPDQSPQEPPGKSLKDVFKGLFGK